MFNSFQENQWPFDGPRNIVALDMDGSTTGLPGSWIVSNQSFYAHPGCTARPEWNAYVCPGDTVPEGFIWVQVANLDKANTNFQDTQNSYVMVKTRNHLTIF